MTAYKEPLKFCGVELACFVLCCGLGGIGWITAGYAPVGAAILVVFFGVTMVYAVLAGFFTGGLALIFLVPVHLAAALISAGLLYWKITSDNARRESTRPADAR